MSFFNQLQPNKSRCIVWQSSFENEKSSHAKCIQEHHFNFSTQLFLPFYDAAFLQQVLHKEVYYAMEIAPCILFQLACDLVSKNCNIFATSVMAPLDTCNSLCILPSGFMLLSLEKDTYEQLGLEGTKNGNAKNLQSNAQNRYTVKLDLHPTKSQKRKERIIWALQQASNVRIALQAFDHEGKCVNNMEPLLQQYGNANMWYKKCETQISVCKKQQVCLPVWNHENLSQESIVKQMEAWMHYMGVIATVDQVPQFDGKQVWSPDTHLLYSQIESNLFGNSECNIASEATWIQINGFISPSYILKLVQQVYQICCQKQKQFASILVRGFEDAIVSWKEQLHGYGISGENDYCLVMWPNKYWLLEMVAQEDLH